VVDTEADALLVVPEPVDWLRPVLEALQTVGTVQVFAPWVLPAPLVQVAGRVGFVGRREGERLPGARSHGWFTAAELLARASARGKTAATLRNRVLLRALADRACAFGLRRGRVPGLVVAPSLAARRTFAAAQRAHSRCLLLEDMPDFDSLVDGLDGLARAQPQASFLRNHRPKARDHARQRAERWQADAVAVRGRIGWHRVGAAKTRVQLPFVQLPPPHQRGTEVAFAGPPLARAGSTMLLPLLDARPDLHIRVQPGPRSEPAALLQHPRVRVDASLDGAGAVLSLGPLESHPRPVLEALQRGIPVVGTLASTGQLDPASIHAVQPDDLDATAGALDQALTAGKSPRAWAPPLTLRSWLRGQYSAASSVTV
jgi:hypothetical protein